MELLSAVARWLRVRHTGVPRWFVAFVLVFAVVVGAVLVTHSGQ